MPRSEKDLNTEPCNVCGKVIRYKADIPRHNRLHTANKAELMHKCHFVGCEYQNLQKSNVATHFRTHTGEKPKSCPDCDYTTSDPGSLTRHRKRIHDYVPKERNFAGKSLKTKQSRRHTPYTHESSEDSFSSASFASTSSASPQIEDKLFDVSTLYEQCFPAPHFNADNARDAFSYPWDKTFPATPEFLAAVSSEPFISPLPSGHNPRHLLSGVDSGNPLQLPTVFTEDTQNFFDYLPSLSYENFLVDSSFSTKEFDILYPTEGGETQTSNIPWADLGAQEFFAPDTSSPQSWDFTFGSPASSSGSLTYSPSPSPSVEFSFYDSPVSESNGMPDFMFPDPQFTPFGQPPVIY